MDKLVRESQKDQVIGQMVRIKKGQEKPEAFRLMTDNEVLQMQMKIIFNWKPHSQMCKVALGYKPVKDKVGARKYHTYAVPSVRNISELSSFLRKTTPVAGSLMALLLVNFGLGMLISERETTLFTKYLSPSLASPKEFDDEGFKNIYVKANGFTIHRNPVAQSTDGARGKIGFKTGRHCWEVWWEGPLGTVGERIRVILDCEDNTLAFEKNYEFLGVAFRGLPDTRLFPAVSAVYGNTEISMVYLGPPLDG
ncbi:hypothetical protein C0Q70_20906 [Pomacea canaliculata]|uniref:SPRY domain-containing protein n=1 Tax=Pomacea canaliculata TaxID=400727 RepID=A0A2T7NB11_POMCA|nr:hypothetical protein C0Q70_20906 [Pomacea canaliculata]